MALKANRRMAATKRSAYVCEDSQSSSVEMNSSEDETVEICERPKVRKGLSIRNLLKESENYKKGEDHIYTKHEVDYKIVSNRESESNLSSTNYPTKRRASVLSKNISKRKIDSEVDDAVDYNSAKRQKCFSKNAVMARLNRERKKKYISSLEDENSKLKEQNEQVCNKIKTQGKIISTLKHEVVYLKSLLANSKEICQILQNLNKTTGLPVSSSMQSVTKDVKKLSPEHGYVSENDVADNLHTASMEYSHPRVRSVTSGSNFPISAKDINLGSFHATYDNENVMSPLGDKGFDDLGSPYFPFEDNILDNAFKNDIDFLENLDFRPSLYDIPVEPFEEQADEKMLDCNELFPNKTIPDVGICLHVNQKRISVELCSLCSTKASASWLE